MQDNQKFEISPELNGKPKNVSYLPGPGRYFDAIQL